MIKTWQQRCEEHPDHEGIVTEQMIRDRMQEEIDQLRQAIAQPEQEPVAWLDNAKCKRLQEDAPVTTTLTPHRVFLDDVALYTTPPQKEWVGLTEDEKYDVLEGATGDGGRVYYDTLFRSYEAKLKEKNGG